MSLTVEGGAMLYQLKSHIFIHTFLYTKLRHSLFMICSWIENKAEPVFDQISFYHFLQRSNSGNKYKQTKTLSSALILVSQIPLRNSLQNPYIHHTPCQAQTFFLQDFSTTLSKVERQIFSFIYGLFMFTKNIFFDGLFPEVTQNKSSNICLSNN